MKRCQFEQVKYIELWLNKVLKQREAARLLGISTRHVRRLFRRYESLGPMGLVVKKRATAPRQFDVKLKNQALSLIKKHFYDYGPSLASEKLDEYFDIQINKETTRQWMIEVQL